ncbi:hypothetical protein Y032_0395g656 [Ancylostoma ceylanicum]|uniref:Uncharacterized protein n=1 Tax=Ancylostoma ceylanicum TaxID=53326 RepID=A0A016RRQ6_9BILA|nr:hypothetical protein Y032_0395g656 [Ancylostoma ceylanicum]
MRLFKHRDADQLSSLLSCHSTSRQSSAFSKEVGTTRKMNALLLILAFVPALSAQLFAIASPGGGMNAGGAIGCGNTGYLRFAGRAAINCGNNNAVGMGGYGAAPCCPCPGAPTQVGAWPWLGGMAATTPQTVILNACVPACCNTGFGGIGTGAFGKK